MMNGSLAFEIGVSLCLQVASIVAICVVLQQWVGDSRWACRLWTICFLSIIAVIAAGVLLPHRRLFSLPVFAPRETMLAIVTWQGTVAVALVAIWGIGLIVSLCRKALLCWQLTRFLSSHCSEVDITELARFWSGIDHSEGWRHRVPNLRVLSSADIDGPFCWQLHRPTIVLPENLLDEDETTLRHILLHELEHLRTQHPMQHFLQGICSTVLWFHPAVWVAARGADLTREFLCDEVAAVSCGTFAAYLRTLAKVAERCGSASCSTAPRGTLAFGNRKSALIRRSERLVELAQDPPVKSPRRPMFAVVGLVLAAVLIQQVWLPTNVLASSRSDWSPWPSWTAEALHNTLDIRVRDFEPFEDRVQIHEWMHRDD